MGASEKPGPDIFTELTVNDALPVLVSVTLCDADELMFTLPKLTDDGDGVSVPCGFVLAETISIAA
jgi:hypothetical protein